MQPDEEPMRIPITDVFDLHTVRPQEVATVVQAYLEEANRLGLKALRLIHGRGIGVQREIVRAAGPHAVRPLLPGRSPRSRRVGRQPNKRSRRAE
jgi:hypothetical protein